MIRILPCQVKGHREASEMHFALASRQMLEHSIQMKRWCLRETEGGNMRSKSGGLLVVCKRLPCYCKISRMFCLSLFLSHSLSLSVSVSRPLSPCFVCIAIGYKIYIIKKQMGYDQPLKNTVSSISSFLILWNYQGSFSKKLVKMSVTCNMYLQCVRELDNHKCKCLRNSRV